MAKTNKSDEIISQDDIDSLFRINEFIEPNDVHT